VQNYQLTVKINEQEIQVPIICEYKKRKSLMLKVYPKTAKILFSMPRNTPDDYAQAFLQKQKPWLQGQLQKVLPYLSKHDYLIGDSFYYLGEKVDLLVKDGKINKAELFNRQIILTQKTPLSEEEKRLLIEKMFHKQAAKVITSLVEDILPTFENLYKLQQKPLIKLRKMDNKWGICRPFSHEITLSKRLIHVETKLIAYVIVHELCHFKHMNHSKDFWSFVGQIIPDYKVKKKLLNQVDVYMTNY